MRNQVLSISKKRSIRTLKDISQPLLVQNKRLSRQGVTGNIQVRSSMRLKQQSIKEKHNGYSKTPAIFLPRLVENRMVIRNDDSSEMDSLQTYVHTLLLKNLKRYKINKEVKSVEEQLEKRKISSMQEQEKAKKQREKSKLQKLRVKLNELYGQLQVQKKQLQIQYSVQAKMQSKYNNYYDKIAKRFKNHTVDQAQNTQQVAISTNKPTKTSKFRVAAIAVYFAILFPKYSKVFAVVRKRDYQQRIISKKQLEKAIIQSYRLFQMMKLKVVWIQLEYKHKTIETQPVKVSLTHSRTQQDDTFGFKVENITSLLKHILTSILTAIKEGKIDHLIKAISLTLLTHSYLTPHLFLYQQLQQMQLDESHRMNLSALGEKSLILNFLLAKLTGFGFMISHRYTNSKSSYIVSPQQNKFQNLTSSISQQLVVCGLYLIKLCNRVNEERGKQVAHQVKIERQSREGRLLVVMQEMKTKERIVVSAESNKKRASIEMKLTDNQSLQVKSVDNLQDLLTVFEGNDDEPQNMRLIMQIQQKVYNNSLKFRKQLYQAYRTQALAQYKQIYKSIVQETTQGSPQQVDRNSQQQNGQNKQSKSMDEIKQSGENIESEKQERKAQELSQQNLSSQF